MRKKGLIMKYKYNVGDYIKCIFATGIILDRCWDERLELRLYKIELTQEDNKGKMPWFAEHELELLD